MPNNVTESVSADNLYKITEAKIKQQTKTQTSSNNEGAKNNAGSKKKGFEDKAKTISQKAKDAESDVYADIDKTLAILETLPVFTDIGLDMITANSFHLQYSPLGLIFDLLNVIGVSDQEIAKFLVNFLVDTLPVIEVGIKAAILANMKSLISCSADPRIPKKLRKKGGEKEDLIFGMMDMYNADDDARGMLIDLDSIDPEGKLSVSPYSERGKNNYFGVYFNEMSMFYNKLGIEENEYNNISSSKAGNTVVKNVKSKWELCRAIDKDAFLWFVIHQATLPTPSEAVINGKSVTINGQTFFETNTDSDKASFLRPTYLSLDSTSGSSKITVGNTVIESGGTGEISLCFSTDIERPDDIMGDSRVVTSYLLPLSSDKNSADWYIDTDQFYKSNLSSKKNWAETYEYNNQMAICTLHYMQPTDYKTKYVGGSTQKLRLTILPKPYIYMPYINTGFENLFNVRRILFDEYGNPDKNGKFSLPTEKLVEEDGNPVPYVRNENISPFSESVKVQKYTQEKSFDDDLKQAIENIKNKKFDELLKLESYKLDAFSIAVQYWKTDDTVNQKKYLSILKQCFNTRLKKEGNDSINNDVIKYRVGEKDDDCALYVNVKSGDYHLGPYSESSKKTNYTKHLVRCYKGLTVYEFNYDFIMGMKLFSPKVVCAKLLDASTNAYNAADFRATINVSKDSSKYQYFGNKQIIDEIVREIVENEDDELSDCFFTFNNDDYETLLNETEEKRFHQQPYLNDKDTTVDLTDVYNLLSEYPENGTKKEQKTVIENAITAATAKVSSNKNVYANADSSKLKINFATNMLEQLVAVLIESILTPKVLLLLAVNKQLMGDGGETFNVKDLLNGVKGLIKGIVKELRDMIIQYLLNYLLDFLGPLVKEMISREVKEKFAVYQDILSQLLGYFYESKSYYNTASGIIGSLLQKFAGYKGKKYSNYDLPTVLDNVDYADIIGNYNNSTDAPITNNC